VVWQVAGLRRDEAAITNTVFFDRNQLKPEPLGLAVPLPDVIVALLVCTAHTSNAT
jgi:hypothetical protein